MSSARPTIEEINKQVRKDIQEVQKKIISNEAYKVFQTVLVDYVGEYCNKFADLTFSEATQILLLQENDLKNKDLTKRLPSQLFALFTQEDTGKTFGAYCAKTLFIQLERDLNLKPSIDNEAKHQQGSGIAPSSTKSSSPSMSPFAT